MTEVWTDRWGAAEAQWVNAGAILIDLPAVAVDAMQNGWDSPSLRLLAGMSTRDDARDLRDTFLAAVRELGRALPAANDAALRLVRFYAGKIIDGSVSPVAGARAVSSLGYTFTGEAQDQVMVFVGLEDEARGGWGRTSDQVDAAIVDAARAVVSS